MLQEASGDGVFEIDPVGLVKVNEIANRFVLPKPGTLALKIETERLPLQTLSKWGAITIAALTLQLGTIHPRAPLCQ
jgi:hypothetical protein